MKFSVALRSETGPREANEDSLDAFDLPGGGYAIVVADGLGGHFGGKVASGLSVAMFREGLLATPEADLESMAQQIHKSILVRHQEPGLKGMATTFTAARIKDGILQGVHCGDSRMVLARGQGIRKLTVDQTEAQRLFVAGKLTKAELAAYPRKNVLESALGAIGDLRLDTIEVEIRGGDRIILTTDGVHNKVKLREMLDVSLHTETTSSFIEDVIHLVEDRRADDNFSIVCLEIF